MFSLNSSQLGYRSQRNVNTDLVNNSDGEYVSDSRYFL